MRPRDAGAQGWPSPDGPVGQGLPTTESERVLPDQELTRRTHARQNQSRGAGNPRDTVKGGAERPKA